MHCNQMLPLQVTIGTNTSTQYDLLVCEKPTCSYQTHFNFHMTVSFFLRGVEGLEENVNLNAFKLNWAAALPPSQALTSADLTLCSNIDESAIEDLPIRGRALGPLLMNSPPCVEKKAASPVCLWPPFPAHRPSAPCGESQKRPPSLLFLVPSHWSGGPPEIRAQKSDRIFLGMPSLQMYLQH